MLRLEGVVVADDAAGFRPELVVLDCVMCEMAEVSCYEKLERSDEAIKCYERAVCNNDREGIAASKLAKLYVAHEEYSKAATYYLKHIEAMGPGAVTDLGSPALVEALMFMANYCIQSHDYTAARQYATRLLDYPGAERDEAKATLRELECLQQRSGAGGGSSVMEEADSSMMMASSSAEDGDSLLASMDSSVRM